MVSQNIPPRFLLSRYDLNMSHTYMYMYVYMYVTGNSITYGCRHLFKRKANYINLGPWASNLPTSCGDWNYKEYSSANYAISPYVYHKPLNFKNYEKFKWITYMKHVCLLDNVDFAFWCSFLQPYYHFAPFFPP